jgi:hypothetical protein
MEIAGREAGVHRANRVAKEISEFVDDNFPDAEGDVFIPVGEMNTLMMDVGEYQSKTDNQSRKWLDGLCAAYPNSGLKRLSLVKRMTGTWVWKWEKSGEAAP